MYDTFRWLTARGLNGTRVAPSGQAPNGQASSGRGADGVSAVGVGTSGAGAVGPPRWYPDGTGGSASFTDKGCGLRRGSAHCDAAELEAATPPPLC